MLDDMQNVKVITELQRDQWSEFVYNHPNGNIFQTPEMKDVWAKTSNNQPYLFASVSEDNKINGLLQGVIQKEYSGVIGRLTARSIIWGGPLVTDHNEKALNLLLEKYTKILGNQVVYSQLRNLWKHEMFFKDPLEKNGFRYEDHLNIILDLTKSENELWNDVHSKRRNEIRRAKKEGTYIREFNTEKEIEESYKILKDVYNHAKVPLHDFSMFKAAHEILHPRGMVKFFGAINQGKLIGTIIVLCYKDRVYDWYAGSLRDYYHLYPNDLLPWEVFLWSKKNGYQVFDFGGAGKPNIPYGVRDYKKKFGGRLVDFGRYEAVHQPIKMQIAKTGLKIWQFMKR